MNHTRLCLSHPSFTIGFVIVDPSIMPESRAADDIKDDKEYKCHNVDHRDFPPALLDATEDTSFARVATIAELRLIVAPSSAVRIGPHKASPRGPYCLIPIGVAALCWGLAATRLKGVQRKGYFTHYAIRNLTIISHLSHND